MHLDGPDAEPDAASAWAEQLLGWGVPDWIVAQASESPWGHDSRRFAVDDTLDRHSTSARWAREVLPPAGGTVLDVGCGGGRASLVLVPPANELIGVDRSGPVEAWIPMFLFAIVFKDSPISLPPSGRLSSGIFVTPLAEVWGMDDVEGLVEVASSRGDDLELENIRGGLDLPVLGGVPGVEDADIEEEVMEDEDDSLDLDDVDLDEVPVDDEDEL